MKNEQKNMAFKMLVFKEVSHQGSFTKAAAVLNLKKSSVSQYISQLEKRLNTPLLTRTTRSLSLTDAGKLFLKHCYSLDTLLFNAIEDIEELNNQPQGTITITAPHALSATVVLPALNELSQRFAQLSVKLTVDDQVQDIVKQGFDIALRVGELEDSSYRAKKLGQLRNIFVASPQYLAAAEPLKAVTDIGLHPFIAAHWQQQTSVQQVYINETQVIDVPCHAKFEVNNTATAAELACLGSGIALLPDIYVQPYIARGELIRIFPSVIGGGRSIYAMHHYPQNMPFKIRACMLLLEEKLNMLNRV